MGYRKGYSSEYSLIVMFENWKENLDKRGECGASFVDLSKAFECLQHDLLLAKLNTYGFEYKFLKLISVFCKQKEIQNKNQFIFYRMETSPYWRTTEICLRSLII